MNPMKGLLNASEPLGISRVLVDIRGVAAIEFALVLPLMLALYFGVAEVGQAVRVSQKVDGAAHVVADLTARKLKDPGDTSSAGTVILRRDLSSIFTAARLFIAPLPTRYLVVEIDEIKTGDLTRRTSPQLVWRVLYNPGLAIGATPPPSRECGNLVPGSADEFLNVPDGLAYSPNGKSYLIAARVYYNFGGGAQPTIFGRSLTLKQWSYAVPRAMPPPSSDNPLELRALDSNYRIVNCPLASDVGSP